MTHLDSLSARRQPRSQRATTCRTAVTSALALLFLLAAQAASAQIRITAAWDLNRDGRTAGYMVSVGTEPGSTAFHMDVGTASSAVLPLPPGDVYYISVRGYNAQRQAGPPSVEATVDLASSPGAPEGLRASVQGAVASLNWTPPSAGYATRYLVSVGTAPGADNLLSEYPVGNLTSVSGALPPGTYYARVQAGNMVGVGPTTTEISFRVGGGGVAPPPPPANLAANWSGGTVTLTWGASSGASSYVIEVGSVSGASNVGVLNIGNTTALSTPVPPGTFYVRVRAVNAAGASGGSNQIVVRR